ncbi:uncharacterized protein APUU_20690A [Aspergillus puulaauensis]|uniref:Zn(2)-C6 fungal-type domain-containing protein n=1 Tax=Aspergillus puulaauensis TaxID=1220207 RepID=A0A7R8AK91_9EURO|nr:uncharacterized protein APUU_20690A [Aspergillus puulaauensis]BCS20258.1 hypothetical protein APUU_20690A [Aspergillus puulaauensis]
MDENNNGTAKRPACDNCKERKTKCDRGSPCSSCVAAELECRLTRRAPEKRQRVLISARYDEAIENVDRSLQDVSRSLQKLLHSTERREQPQNDSPAPFVSNHLLDTSGTSEGYTGDSSFEAHVQRVADAVKNAALSLDLRMADADFSATHATQILHTPDNTDSAYSSSFQVRYPELDGRTLPPLDPVLRLLRLLHTEKQRFFIDVPVVGEQEFEEICQRVYFAVNHYSLSAWIIVNAGLYYLFLNLSPHHFSQIAVTRDNIQEMLRLLSANLEAAIQSIRLCQDPSLQWCQALSLLTNYCLKFGRTAVAWSMISSASRMCIDLGFHQLSSDTGKEILKKRSIFWHVYVVNTGMAFTLGRTPTIPQYDIATTLPSFSHATHGAPFLYIGFVQFSFIVGEMHIQLFSAAAQQSSPQARADSAQSFAAKLAKVNNDVKRSLLDTPVDAVFENASILVDIVMHCFVTIAYRLVPSSEPNSHPLQCNSGCIDAARQALSTIVRGSQTLGQRDSLGWARFLNFLFSLVPFASFVVLAGNTVASSSAEDLALLSAAIAAIEPIATSSLPGRKLYDACQSFYQFSRFAVARQVAFADQTLVSSHGPEAPFSASLGPPQSAVSYEHIMAPQDWDAVMNELDLEIGVGAMASFVEPYIPFDGSLP